MNRGQGGGSSGNSNWRQSDFPYLMVRGFRTFKELEESGEGIATNILANRLRKVEATRIIAAEVEQTDGRRVNYRLTGKGVDLAPVLLELLIWGRGTRRRGPRAL